MIVLDLVEATVEWRHTERIDLFFRRIDRVPFARPKAGVGTARLAGSVTRALAGTVAGSRAARALAIHHKGFNGQAVHSLCAARWRPLSLAHARRWFERWHNGYCNGPRTCCLCVCQYEAIEDGAGNLHIVDKATNKCEASTCLTPVVTWDCD